MLQPVSPTSRIGTHTVHFREHKSERHAFRYVLYRLALRARTQTGLGLCVDTGFSEPYYERSLSERQTNPLPKPASKKIVVG
uniref:Uncharacterized protein n=1 Tax=Candidatus Kentrum sp. MB TaxID=2138164 RepID=A0A450XP68_9GAMM|nr:MAG: hypothetical protein BECKMB1821G_GA0114241_107819 [Candidatus Kentron sp. MB]